MTFDTTAWQTAEAPAQGDYPEKVPPANGSYTAMLADATLFMSKKGNRIAKFTFDIVTTGESWDDISTVEKQGEMNAVAVGIVKDKLIRMGVPQAKLDAVQDWDELATLMQAPVGDFYDIDVKTNAKGFTNVYCNGRVDGFEKPAVESTADMFPPKAAGPNTADMPAGSTIDW